MINGPENAAREAAMAKRLIQAGTVAVAGGLGKGHDLADEMSGVLAGSREAGADGHDKQCGGVMTAGRRVYSNNGRGFTWRGF